MKLRNKAVTLLATAALMIFMTAPAFANSYTLDSATCKFDGENLQANFNDGDLVTSISSLEPGDSLEYTITYSNDSKQTVDFYMRADTLKTLEESKDAAENGGYRFVLEDNGPNGKTVLFDNSKVGGDTVVADLEGLHQATNATQEYFHIHQLKPGQKGTTFLKVEFDEETEANDYMDTIGKLRISYAVELTNEPGEPPIEHQPKTGDSFDLLKYILLMTAALIIGLIALFSWRKDRKDGEKA